MRKVIRRRRKKRTSGPAEMACAHTSCKADHAERITMLRMHAHFQVRHMYVHAGQACSDTRSANEAAHYDDALSAEVSMLRPLHVTQRT